MNSIIENDTYTVKNKCLQININVYVVLCIYNLPLYTRKFSMKLTVRTTGWARFNCTRVKLGTASIEHERNCARYQLSTSTTVHRINWAPLQLCTTATILLPIFPNLCRAHFLLYYIYFRSTGESIDAK